MTREQVEELCGALESAGHCTKAGMFRTHDAEQRAEIERLQAQLAKAKREVWVRVISEIDYRHSTVTMDQTTLKEWCMARYREVKP